MSWMKFWQGMISRVATIPQRCLEVLDRTAVGRAVEKRVKLVKVTDPDNIYVENVRAFFGITTKLAVIICELAVKEGSFNKRRGLMCPRDRNVIAYLGLEETPPELVRCAVCEALGEEEFEFLGHQLDLANIYSLAPKLRSGHDTRQRQSSGIPNLG